MRVQTLSWPIKLGFGIGASGEAVYIGLFNAFITIFYNQAIGLSNSLIGIAVMLALIGDAITDPMVGIISDRWRSRHGRRHPFLLAAPIPLALSIYAIFNPPDWVQFQHGETWQAGLFIWLALWTILSRVALTLYAVPHLALGGELSSDQYQRSQLFSANTMVFYVAGASFAFVAWSILGNERIRVSDGATVPGQLDPAAYGPLILGACAVILITIWSCAAATYKEVQGLSQPPENQPRLGILDLLRNITSTFKNRNYMVMLVAYFFFMIASGIYDTLNVFINTYFWQLSTDQIRWLGLVAAPCAMLGALCSPILMRRFDRKPVMLGSLTLVALFAQLVVDLRLLGLMPVNGDPLLLPLLICNAAGFTFSLGLGTVAVMSMIGDIIDQNEAATGKREDGLFYSARAFFAKASYSFGHLFAGVMLDIFVRLPNEAIPGKLADDVLFRLGFTAGPIMALAAIVSLAIYSRYRLSAAEHAQILAKLGRQQT